MYLPTQAAVMTLRGATLFPHALLPLYIFEARYRQMLAEALHGDRMFAVAMQEPGRPPGTPCTVAGLGLVRVAVRHRNSTSHLILQGLARVELLEPLRLKPYRVQRIRPLPTPPADTVALDALMVKVRALVRRRVQQAAYPIPSTKSKDHSCPAKGSAKKFPFASKVILKYLARLPDAGQVADLVACALLPDPDQRQTILESIALEPRLRHLIHFLVEQIQCLPKNHPA